MTAPDAAAIARELGAEKVIALGYAIFNEAECGGIEAAARRLAAPLPPAPRWPDRVWAVFRNGVYSYASSFRVDAGVPARLVPADAVVLDRGDALAALRWLRELQRRGFTYAGGGSDHIETTAAALRAALATSAPTPEER